MPAPDLVLVLGDQLTAGRGALATARAGVDHVVMAEVAEEATYVAHNRHKIALIFAAMRNFCEELRGRGFTVHYFPWEQGVRDLREAVVAALQDSGAVRLRCCEPGEYRVLENIRAWELDVPLEICTDDRFLCSRNDFAAWAKGRKQLRMEFFYREMRKRYELLLDASGKPEGGKWNYDADNRKGWRGKEPLPERPRAATTGPLPDVLRLVAEAFPDQPGDLGRFDLATDRAGAESQFEWFVDNALGKFGTYQDALAEESPWLFHSLISMYLNIGLLDPLAVCRRVEDAYRSGDCDLAAAEGFIRQILGWREYVRGVYWLHMPEYGSRNSLGAEHPLPGWFWSGATELRCLASALTQTLELGYAHHIQRLMVIGNFCLLTGISPEEVCAWYLAVYVDAFEWVELPNTLGMALHGDDGLMASKPYAASGKYIQRQGNHCSACRYDPGKVTGDGACPYNSLYWRFIDRHRSRWESNPRMGLALRNWERKPARDQAAILDWAERELVRLLAD